MNESAFIWMNGEMKPWNEATIHVGTHALHYGTGVFEGMRAYETERGPGIVRLHDHMCRLDRSAAMYYMELPFDTTTLEQAAWDLLDANKLDAAYLRPIAWRGYRKLGLYPLDNPVEVAILAWPWGAYLGDDSIEHGIKAKVSSWQRFSSTMLHPQAKACGQYLNWVHAKVEASYEGYDEAIMLNDKGLVAECSGDNIFIVHEDFRG
ncbi:MAG: aminotransferase class IV, partial [Thermoleophilia bacterium]|nr:aminotransferase class IV [Thermoleophilia bacterium]